MKISTLLLITLSLFCAAQCLDPQNGWFENRTLEYYLLEDYNVPTVDGKVSVGTVYRVIFDIRDEYDPDSGQRVRVPLYADTYGDGYEQAFISDSNQPPVVKVVHYRAPKKDSHKTHYYNNTAQIKAEGTLVEEFEQPNEIIVQYDTSKLTGKRPAKYGVLVNEAYVTAINSRTGINTITNVYTFPEIDNSIPVFDKIQGSSGYSLITRVHECKVKDGKSYDPKKIFSAALVKDIADCVPQEKLTINVIVHADPSVPDSGMVTKISFTAVALATILFLFF